MLQDICSTSVEHAARGSSASQLRHLQVTTHLMLPNWEGAERPVWPPYRPLKRGGIHAGYAWRSAPLHRRLVAGEARTSSGRGGACGARRKRAGRRGAQSLSPSDVMGEGARLVLTIASAQLTLPGSIRSRFMGCPAYVARWLTPRLPVHEVTPRRSGVLVLLPRDALSRA